MYEWMLCTRPNCLSLIVNYDNHIFKTITIYSIILEGFLYIFIDTSVSGDGLLKPYKKIPQ